VIDPSLEEIEKKLDWSTAPADGFPYELRQEPGPHDALGPIEITLPSQHHVHRPDTPKQTAAPAATAACLLLLEQQTPLGRVA
jgi:murein L,D-transpeptidase YcbB/YkuD